LAWRTVSGFLSVLGEQFSVLSVFEQFSVVDLANSFRWLAWRTVFGAFGWLGEQFLVFGALGWLG